MLRTSQICAVVLITLCATAANAQTTGSLVVESKFHTEGGTKILESGVEKDEESHPAGTIFGTKNADTSFSHATGRLKARSIFDRGRVKVNVSGEGTGWKQSAGWQPKRLQVGTKDALGFGTVTFKTKITNTDFVAHDVHIRASVGSRIHRVNPGVTEVAPATGSASITGPSIALDVSVTSADLPYGKETLSDLDNDTAVVVIPAGGSITYTLKISGYAEILDSVTHASGEGWANLEIMDIGGVAGGPGTGTP